MSHSNFEVKAGAITKGAAYGAASGAGAGVIDAALRLTLARDKGKALKKIVKKAPKKILKGTVIGTGAGAALKGYKKAKGFSKDDHFHFSPALSLFARTQGAKDKKKRKRRGLGKKLAIGAGLGVLGVAGARYGKAAVKGGALGVKQLKRYKAPIRKNLKYIKDAAKSGVTEKIGQDKALVQNLLEKYKNRKSNPLADVDSRNRVQKYVQRKWEELIPDEATRKPLEIADKIAKGYTRGAYDIGRMIERGSNIKRTVTKKVKKKLGIKDKPKNKKRWKPPWEKKKWEDRKWSTD